MKPGFPFILFLQGWESSLFMDLWFTFLVSPEFCFEKMIMLLKFNKGCRFSVLPTSLHATECEAPRQCYCRITLQWHYNLMCICIRNCV